MTFLISSVGGVGDMVSYLVVGEHAVVLEMGG
jgi:hypothetical protein